MTRSLAMETTELKRTFDCTKCHAKFCKLRMLLQHRREAGHHRVFPCEVCLKEFTRKDTLARHVTHSHGGAGKLHECGQCDKVYRRKDNLHRHVLESHAGLSSGRVSRKKPVVDLNMFLKTSRSVIRIPKDDLSLARALATAILRQSPTWNGTRHGQSKQVTLAKRLHACARVSMGRCGLIDEVKRFQAVLKGCQINLVSPAAINGVVYRGPDYEKRIYLCYQDEHFHVITSRAGFLHALYYLRSSSCDNIHNDMDSEQVDEQQQQQPDV